MVDQLEEDWTFVSSMITNMSMWHDPKAIWPDYKDLRVIYDLIRSRKPEVVFEYGSGYSTLVIAKALELNNHGHLYSMESETYWRDKVAEQLERQIKSPIYTIAHSPTLKHYDKETHGWLYTRHPNFVCPNLIYLDGPALTDDRKVTFLPVMREGCTDDFALLIDGRHDTVEWYKDFYHADNWLSNSGEIIYHDLNREGDTDQALFVRTP